MSNEPGTINWQARQLRMTCFFHAPKVPDLPKVGMWASLVGEEPTLSENKPREATWREVGEFGGGNLTLQRSPTRIDGIWDPAGEPFDRETGDVLNLGPYDRAEETFRKLWPKFLAGLSVPVARVACGAILISKVTDRSAGYRVLGELLPAVKLDPAGSSDFIYQINRPRPSRVIDGVKVNRLSNWLITQPQFVQLTMQGKTIVPLSISSSMVCQVTLDVNTALREDGQPLPSTQLSGLFVELTSLASEISKRGDIA